MSLHKSNTAWSWWALPSYLHQCNCDWMSYTTWSNWSCWSIPRGMVTAILFLVDQIMCDWLNHTTWFHSNRALPCSMEFESMLLHFFYIIQSPIFYVGCLMIANTWIYISLYLRNTAILENKKTVLYFLVSACEQLWPSHSRLVNCAKCEQILSKYVADW